METTTTTAVIKKYFKSECDYKSLLEETVAAQAQLLDVYECLGKLPEDERPGVQRITDFMMLVAELLPTLRPIAEEVE